MSYKDKSPEDKLETARMGLVDVKRFALSGWGYISKQKMVDLLNEIAYDLSEIEQQIRRERE